MKGSHLTMEDRQKIQEGIKKELTKIEIAKNIGKDPTTVTLKGLVKNHTLKTIIT